MSLARAPGGFHSGAFAASGPNRTRHVREPVALVSARLISELPGLRIGEPAHVLEPARTSEIHP